MAKDQGIACGLNLHLDATATMCLVNRRGLGKAKHVDMQNLWIQEASMSKRFVTKVGTNVNRADLMMKPLPRPKIDQLMKLTVRLENDPMRPKSETSRLVWGSSVPRQGG